MRRRLLALLVLLLLVALSGLAGQWHWLADLGNHFRLQYVGAAFVLLLLAVGLRDRACIGLGIVTGWVTLASWAWPLRGALLPRDALPAHGPTLTVVTANLQVGNRDLGILLDWLRATRPDVLVVQENDVASTAALDRLDPRLRRVWAQPEEGAFGLGVWAAVPTGTPEPRELGPYALASVRVPLHLGGTVVELYATHPFPPIGGEGSAARDQQFRELADWLSQQPGPALLVGDLNATPWSQPLDQLAQRARLADGSHRRWPLPTWRPTRLGPLAALLALPIDHVLLRGGWLLAHARGPEFHSDHRPLWAQVRFLDQPADATFLAAAAPVAPRMAATTAASNAPGPAARH